MPDTDISSDIEEPDNDYVYVDSNGRLNANGVVVSVLVLAGLPTADPHVVGQVWNSAATLKVSAG
jgi:hypothetical protein